MTSLLLALLLMICELVPINVHIPVFVCDKGTQVLIDLFFKIWYKLPTRGQEVRYSGSDRLIGTCVVAISDWLRFC